MRTTTVTMAAAIAAALMAASAGTYAQATPECPGGGPGMRYGAGPGMMRHGGGPGMMGWGGAPGPRAGVGPRGGGPEAGAACGAPRVGAGAGPAANADVRLAEFKNQLKITSEQQIAFDAYAATVKKSAADMQTLRAAMFQTQNAADHIAQRAEHMKQRAGDMEAVASALKDLYAVLTPEQKTVADAYLGRRFGPAGPGGRYY